MASCINLDYNHAEMVAKYAPLISTLPLSQNFNLPLRNYHGFWMPERYLPRVLALHDHFKAQPTDVILSSYPKCGTTWLKALAFAISNRSRYSPSSSDHPLLRLNPHECVPYLEMDYGQGPTLPLDALPSPRLLATHIPFQVLPSSIRKSESRIIYVCREPKDVVVSLWHFANKYWPSAAGDCPLSNKFESLVSGESAYGPIWNHNLEYWKESLKRPMKVLFLNYEEMKRDPLKSARKMAEFMACPFSAQEEEDGEVEKVVKLCSFEHLSNLDVNKTIIKKTDGGFADRSAFFRKGVVGDWANHLSPEMAEKLDRISEEKLRGSGLVF